MNTLEAIDAALGDWWTSASEGRSRARAVLDWCQANGVDTASVVDYQLAAAANEFGKADMRPSDYVAVLRVLVVFLRARR